VPVHKHLFPLAGALCLLFSASAVSAQVAFHYTSCQNAANSQTTRAVTTGDFDLDGRPDVAFTDTGNGGQVFVCRNQGNDTFASTGIFGVPGAGSIQAGDVNGDGKLNLVVSGGTSTAPNLTLLEGNGAGSFATAQVLPTARSVYDLKLADLNCDGRPDVITYECAAGTSTTPQTCDVRSYDSAGGVLAYKSTLIANSTSIFSFPQIADLNIDGKNDVAISTSDAGGSRVLVFKGNGDGTFQNPYTVNAPGSLALISNFDSRPAPDLAIVTPAPCSGEPCHSYVSIYLNNGNGTFTFKQQKFVQGGGALAAADFNGDGELDIYERTSSHFYGNSGILLGNGDGTFEDEQSLGSPDFVSLPVVRDINLDGRHDLLWGVGIGGNISITLNSNASVICAPPGANKLQANFCSPANGATVPSIFTVTGAGNSPAGLLRFELWVDGTKKMETRNDQLSSRQTLASGSHTLTLVAVDLFGSYSKTTETVTVSNSPTCYPSAPGATICSPTPNSTVSSPVQVSAGGDSAERLYHCPPRLRGQ
jgi:FG-GAP-like repeat